MPKISISSRIGASTVLLLLDLVWLKLFMGGKYNRLVPNIQGSPMVINKTYAILAYFLLVLGLNALVLRDISPRDITLQWCLHNAFVFGIVVYGVYDCTCGAIFTGWDSKLAVVDILWGGILFALSAYSIKWFETV